MHTIFSLIYIANDKLLFSTGRRKMGIFRRNNGSSIEESISKLFPDICDFEIYVISKSDDVCGVYSSAFDIEIQEYFCYYTSDFLVTKTMMKEVEDVSLYDTIQKYFDTCNEIPEFIPKYKEQQTIVSIVEPVKNTQKKSTESHKEIPFNNLTLENVDGKCIIM